MSRRVSVILELVTGEYIQASVKVSSVTKAVTEEMKSLDRNVDKVDRSMAELGVTANVAKRQVDGFGDEARGAARDLAILDAQIAATKLAVRALGMEFARTGDETVGAKWKQESRRLAEMQRLSKSLTKGSSGMFGFLDDFGGLPSDLRGLGIAAGVAVAAGAAPVIAGTISAAVVGAVGLGGVAGGAFLAAQNPVVKQAWKDMGQSLLTELENAAQGFVGPVIQASYALKQDFEQSGFLQVIKESAKLVDPAERAIGGFIRELGPGFRRAIEGAGPVLNQFAVDFTDFGGAISKMLDDFADAAPQAAVAFHDFFDAIDQGVEATGNLFEVLTKLYPLVRQPGIDQIPWFGLLDVYGKLTDQGQIMGVSLGDNTKALHDQAIEADLTEKAIAELNGETKAMFDNQMDVDKANLNVQKGFVDLAQTLKDNKNAWSDHTKAGLEDRGMLLNQVQALYDQRAANIKANMSQEDANKIYQDGINKLKGMVGNSKDAKRAFDDLAGDYRIRIFEERIIGQEVVDWSTLRNLERKAAGRANGGPVMAGVPYRINERGSETVTFPASGTVHPASLSPAGGTVRIIVQDTSGRTLLNAISDDLVRSGVPQQAINAWLPTASLGGIG